jgi:hypothetical protein
MLYAQGEAIDSLHHRAKHVIEEYPNDLLSIVSP